MIEKEREKRRYNIVIKGVDIKNLVKGENGRKIF